MNAGRVILPYKIMERLLNKECEHLKDARIAIAWRKGWPAVQDRIKLGQMKLASDCDRAYKDFDFLMLLNAEMYRNSTASEESLTMTIHHMLLCGAPALDREGEQKTDEKDRLCWKTRKPPIVEFPEIIKTYGAEKTLGLMIDAIAAIKEGPRPLLDAIEKAATQSGDGADKAWRMWDVRRLQDYGLPSGKLKLLEEAGLTTMGKLMDAMNRQGHEDFWWRDIKGLGEGGYDALTEAIVKLRKKNPDFQCERQVEPTAAATTTNASMSATELGEELEANIIRMSNLGTGMKKIAKELNISERQVRKVLGKL
jgi:hypothetical protein